MTGAVCVQGVKAAVVHSVQSTESHHRGTRFKYVLNTLEILVHKIFKNVHKIVHNLNHLLIVYFRTVTTLICFFFLPFK